MSDIKIFVKDKDGEGEWKDIDEDLLDLTEHDAKVKTEVIEKVGLAMAGLVSCDICNLKCDKNERECHEIWADYFMENYL